ncbi:hypothetical protein WS62_12215 [Burkholderia sp. ABCPW 14]|nr:hypothetical protein WS62_12215 [Burkholderia sp. ABCPW 14]
MLFRIVSHVFFAREKNPSMPLGFLWTMLARAHPFDDSSCSESDLLRNTRHRIRAALVMT